MTRASDADTYGEQGAESLDEGSYFFVTGGTSLKGAAFVCNTAGTITFGTTPITFGEFSQAQVYSAGNGISLTATTISLASPVVVSNGGTGLTTTPTNGQLLIGNCWQHHALCDGRGRYGHGCYSDWAFGFVRRHDS